MLSAKHNPRISGRKSAMGTPHILVIDSCNMDNIQVRSFSSVVMCFENEKPVQNKSWTIILHGSWKTINGFWRNYERAVKFMLRRIIIL